MLKFWATLSFLAATCSGTQILLGNQNFDLDLPQILEQTTEYEKTELVNLLTLAVTQYLNKVQFDPDSFFDAEGELRFPVFPGFPEDFMELPDAHLYLPEDSGIANWIRGDIHFCNTTIRGLSTIYNDLKLKFLGERSVLVSLDFVIGQIYIEGRQDNDLNFFNNTLLLSAYEGFFFELTNFRFNVTIEIESIFQKFNVVNFECLDLGLDQIRTDFENTWINGTELEDGDWVEISGNLTILIHGLLYETIRPVLNLIGTPIVHNLLDECSLWILLMDGNLSCVGRAPPASDAIGVVLEPLEVQPSLPEILADFVIFSESDICPAASIGEGDDTTTESPPTTKEPEDNGAMGMMRPFLILIISGIFACQI